MKASVVDLRYRMNDVLKALRRNERVTVLHRGKVRGVILPKIERNPVRAAKHPFFGSAKTKKPTVSQVMSELRRPRYDDL